MDKSKEMQIKSMFKRVIRRTHKELNKEKWSPQAEDIIINASASQMLKEVTIRTYIE